MSSAILPQVVLVEWCAATAENVEPRLRTKQLPALDTAARLGAWTALPACASDAAWPWPERFADFHAANRRVFARGWPTEAGNADDDTCVAPEDIDARVLAFFPPLDGASLAELRRVLAMLYSVHNALIDAAADESAPALLAGRYDLIGSISRFYARESSLPQALRAAYQLLDLLLADLNAARNPAGALLVCARTGNAQSGFACFFAAKLPRAEWPRLVEPR